VSRPDPDRTGLTGRRAAAAVAAGLAAFAVCLAGSVWQQVARVARVDDVSVWRALHRRWHMVVTSWHTSLTALDWLLFAGVAVGTAALVAAWPTVGRFARARRRTE